MINQWRWTIYPYISQRVSSNSGKRNGINHSINLLSNSFIVKLNCKWIPGSELELVLSDIPNWGQFSIISGKIDGVICNEKVWFHTGLDSTSLHMLLYFLSITAWSHTSSLCSKTRSWRHRQDIIRIQSYSWHTK